MGLLGTTAKYVALPAGLGYGAYALQRGPSETFQAERSAINAGAAVGGATLGGLLGHSLGGGNAKVRMLGALAGLGYGRYSLGPTLSDEEIINELSRRRYPHGINPAVGVRMPTPDEGTVYERAGITRWGL